MKPSNPEQLILEPAERRETILNLLRNARRRVIMSLFRCDDSRVLDEIVATARRQVEIKVLVTPSARGWNKRLVGLVTLLKDTGVDVRQYRGKWPKYHAKYLVADDEIAMIGSMNMTRKCFTETCDFVLISQSPDITSGLATLFEFDWNADDAPLPDLGNRLIVGPDHARSQIIGLLDKAQTRIRIIDPRLTDSQILLMIASKMQAGIHVDILGRGEVGNLDSHGKMILVDERLAFFGSVPLRKSGLNGRREVAVAIEDAAMVGELSRFFQNLVELNANRPSVPIAVAVAKAVEDDEDDDDD